MRCDRRAAEKRGVNGIVVARNGMAQAGFKALCSGPRWEGEQEVVGPKTKGKFPRDTRSLGERETGALDYDDLNGFKAATSHGLKADV